MALVSNFMVTVSCVKTGAILWESIARDIPCVCDKRVPFNEQSSQTDDCVSVWDPDFVVKRRDSWTVSIEMAV